MDNVLVTSRPMIRFYAGAPLLVHVNGAQHAIGTLCVIDDKPRAWSDADEDMLRSLAKIVRHYVTLYSGGAAAAAAGGAAGTGGKIGLAVGGGGGRGGGTPSFPTPAAMFANVLSLQREAAESKEAARVASEESARAKGRFLANVSHELRTPMNAITACATLMRDREDELGLENRELLQIIDQSSKHMLDLVNNILSFSKEDNALQGMSLAKGARVSEVFDLRECVEQVIELQSAAIGMRRAFVELAYVFSDEVCDHYVGDPLGVKTVLLNLVSNAVKFTERGHVKITVTEHDVVADDDDHKRRDVRFTVSDTGPGIPADKLETIFRPFEQADDATTRSHCGTGLGLSISRSIVKRLGGVITARANDELSSPLLERDDDEKMTSRGAAVDFNFHMERAEDAHDAWKPRKRSALVAVVVSQSDVVRSSLLPLLRYLGIDARERRGAEELRRLLERCGGECQARARGGNGGGAGGDCDHDHVDFVLFDLPNRGASRAANEASRECARVVVDHARRGLGPELLVLRHHGSMPKTPTRRRGGGDREDEHHEHHERQTTTTTTTTTREDDPDAAEWSAIFQDMEYQNVIKPVLATHLQPIFEALASRIGASQVRPSAVGQKRRRDAAERGTAFTARTRSYADGREEAAPDRDPSPGAATAAADASAANDRGRRDEVDDLRGGVAAAADAAADKPLKILVVDDNRLNREVMTRLLRSCGFANVHLAEGGAEAIELCRHDGKGDFDIVLMDVHMPEMDGFKASMLIHRDADERGERRPRTVIITADATDEVKASCGDAGLEFLTKPVQREDLRRVLAGGRGGTPASYR